jgi:hypothetical protein
MDDDLNRKADTLASLCTHGFEHGLRGQSASDFTWWEGTQAMVDAFERGVAAGLKRREELRQK